MVARQAGDSVESLTWITRLTALDQTDEEIVTYPASDEALEAAAGIEGAVSDPAPHLTYWNGTGWEC